MDTFQCIFCLRELLSSQKSIEHVLPDSLGGTLTFDLVCKDCNSFLGANVDHHLTSNFFSASKRFSKGLLGKKGNLKHPMSRGVIADRPNVRVDWEITQDGAGRITVQDHVEAIDQTDGTTRLNVIIDKSREANLVPLLEKLRERYAKRGMKLDNPSPELVFESRPSPAIQFEHKFDLIGYQIALFKIVYECAFINRGSVFLTTKVAEKLRSLIMNPNVTSEDIEAARLQGDIGFYDLDKDVFSFISKPDHLIIYYVGSIDMVYVRVFDIFTCCVSVSDQESNTDSDPLDSWVVEFYVDEQVHKTSNLQEIISKYVLEKENHHD